MKDLGNSFLEANWRRLLLLGVTINLVVRVIIYFTTELFLFKDYASYLNMVDIIYREGSVPLLGGNFLYAISYLGYFAKYILGGVEWFFIFNSLLGTLATLLITTFVYRLANVKAALITLCLLSCYTEFLVFSSLFYTPIIMLFLVSAFIKITYHLFLPEVTVKKQIICAVLVALIFYISFLFKPELLFLPIFLLPLILYFYFTDRRAFRKTLIISVAMMVSFICVLSTGIYRQSEDRTIANDFVFFGHTDYGGDGGKGSFIYPENKERYMAALEEYANRNGLIEPARSDINRFQREEVIKFVTRNPHKWMALQLRKFFGTFGVVPESTSFLILYTGILNNNLWLTIGLVVIPVVTIIVLFILFFNPAALRNLFNSGSRSFTLFFFLLFAYYIVATIFFGHYQVRYRLPLFVFFIIPLLGIFSASLSKKVFMNRKTLAVRAAILILFVSVWLVQTVNAYGNKQRLYSAIQMAESDTHNTLTTIE